MKKLGILLLACITALNLSAEKCKMGKFRFKIETPTTVELIGADKDITNVFLSETIDYEGNSYTITSIGGRAFHGCNSLTTITIPNSIRIIENWCFSVCTSLTTIHYNGSKRTWDAITKGKDWNAYVPAKVIHCIDGDIKIGGLFDFLIEPLQFLKR